MGSKTYMGMCIGGPRAGQLMECPADTFRVPVLSEPNFFSLNPHLASASTKTEVETVRYEYQPWGMGDFKAGVWVVAGQSPIDTFDTLLKAYAQQCEAEK